MVEKVSKIKIHEGPITSLDELKEIAARVTQTYGAWPVVEGEVKLFVVQQNYWNDENYVGDPPGREAPAKKVKEDK